MGSIDKKAEDAQAKADKALDDAKKQAASESAAAAKKASAVPGTVSEEKTGGMNTPSAPSIHDANRSNKKESIANAIMQDPALSQSAISEKSGAQMPYVDVPKPQEAPPVEPVEPPPGPEPKTFPMVTEPVTAVADKPAETKPVSGPGQVTAEVSPADQNAVVEEIKADPKIGEQILQLAKDTGRTILEVVQGFAKGYSGSDIPLISQVRQERERLKQQQQFAAEQTEKEREFAIQRDKVNQDFQMNIAQIQENWRNKQFAATTQAEKEAADRERDFQAQEAQKNRNTQLDIAKMQTTFAQQGRGMTREQQLAAALQDVFGKGK